MWFRTQRMKGLLSVLLLAVTLDGNAETYGFGRAPTGEELAEAEVDVRFDGVGLPPGQGNALAGAKIYMSRCATCHGAQLEGNSKLYIQPIKGERRHAINNQPFAPPIFAYIRRAMPLTAPGSLSNDEVYSVLAYLLREVGILAGDNPVLDAQQTRQVEMPNRPNFVPAKNSGVTLPGGS